MPGDTNAGSQPFGQSPGNKSNPADRNLRRHGEGTPWLTGCSVLLGCVSSSENIHRLPSHQSKGDPISRFESQEYSGIMTLLLSWLLSLRTSVPTLLSHPTVNFDLLILTWFGGRLDYFLEFSSLGINFYNLPLPFMAWAFIQPSKLD